MCARSLTAAVAAAAVAAATPESATTHNVLSLEQHPQEPSSGDNPQGLTSNKNRSSDSSVDSVAPGEHFTSYNRQSNVPFEAFHRASDVLKKL